MSQIVASTPVTQLACALCGRTYGPSEVRYACPSCGPNGQIEMLYDYEAAARRLQPDLMRSSAVRGLGRYLPILPVGSAQSLPPLRVGVRRSTGRRGWGPSWGWSTCG